MRHQIWAAQLRTLSLEIEADTSAEAERRARRAVAGTDRDNWLICGTEISVVQLGKPDDQQPGSIHHRQLLTVPDAAENLGISRTTLYSELKSGTLHSVRIRRRRFVARTQLDEYLAAHTEASDR